jgi:hypothetical protein
MVLQPTNAYKPLGVSSFYIILYYIILYYIILYTYVCVYIYIYIT